MTQEAYNFLRERIWEWKLRKAAQASMPRQAEPKPVPVVKDELMLRLEQACGVAA